MIPSRTRLRCRHLLPCCYVLLWSVLRHHNIVDFMTRVTSHLIPLILLFNLLCVLKSKLIRFKILLFLPLLLSFVSRFFYPTLSATLLCFLPTATITTSIQGFSLLRICCRVCTLWCCFMWHLSTAVLCLLLLGALPLMRSALLLLLLLPLMCSVRPAARSSRHGPRDTC
jgi:hypothetical protein